MTAMVLERLSPERVHEIALGMHYGTIFSSDQITHLDPNGVRSVFMPLVLIDPKTLPDPKSIGMIIGPMSAAAPVSINGMPCLFECELIGNEDAKLVREKYREIKAAIDNTRPAAPVRKPPGRASRSSGKSRSRSRNK